MSYYTERRPAVSLEAFAAERGVPIPSDADYAEIIGGAYAESTQSGRGKVASSARRIAAFEAVAAEYRAACADGTIPHEHVRVELPEGSEAARAMARARARREARREADGSLIHDVLPGTPNPATHS